MHCRALISDVAAAGWASDSVLKQHYLKRMSERLMRERAGSNVAVWPDPSNCYFDERFLYMGFSESLLLKAMPCIVIAERSAAHVISILLKSPAVTCMQTSDGA